MLILTWTGAVLGLSLLLIMALGPAIVEIDARLYERRHEKRRRRVTAAAAGSAAEPSRGFRSGSSSTIDGSRPAIGPRIAVRTQPTHIS
jgi:hypothetical protein